MSWTRKDSARYLKRDVQRWRRELARLEAKGMGDSTPARMLRGWIADAERVVSCLAA